jgi:hypothetical protein
MMDELGMAMAASRQPLKQAYWDVASERVLHGNFYSIRSTALCPKLLDFGRLLVP